MPHKVVVNQKEYQKRKQIKKEILLLKKRIKKDQKRNKFNKKK